MTALFGPDGIGGQPGLVGKAGNAVWNGTGDLPEGAGFGATLANSLGNIPHFLTDIAVKNPLEILKNPASALNDRGEVSITRLLFPDFRRNAEKEDKQRSKLRDAYTASQVFNTYDSLVGKLMDTPADQRGGMVDFASQAGVPDEELNNALGQADAADQEQHTIDEAVQTALPGVPAALTAGGTRQQGLGAILAKSRQDAIDRRANARAAASAARAAATAAKTDPRSFQQKAADRRAEREATANAAAASAQIAAEYAPRVKQAQLEESGKPAAIAPEDELLTSKTLLKTQLLRARQARRNAYAAIDEALPPVSRQNIGLRKKLRQVVPAVVQAAQDVGLDNPVLADVPPPTDPAQRVAAAHELGTALLKAGFPPEKAAAEMLRRGYKPEELPE